MGLYTRAVPRSFGAHEAVRARPQHPSGESARMSAETLFRERNTP
ncbi:hypothetical protein HMPREF9056_00905 [Actinomyces sp. oral taxon 170 str. F0386]|nr:hypothetical protein HMPREF9056_00905 [Actinomyces sp. oral taxon 170 str. F0386]